MSELTPEQKPYQRLKRVSLKYQSQNAIQRTFPIRETMKVYRDGQLETLDVFRFRSRTESENERIERVTWLLKNEIIKATAIELAVEWSLDEQCHKRFELAETWASYWIASSVGYLLPKEQREEWLGDLYEVNRDMLDRGYPRWWINVLAVGRTVRLIVSSLHIKLSDLVSIGIRKSE